MSDDTVTITDNATGKQVELKILRPAAGPAAIDIRSLYKELGYFAYDPGFLSTASCWSNITFLDGNEGILQYRGYPIEQLADHSNYMEVCYLLLHGELPKSNELAEFEKDVKSHTLLHEALKRFYSGFRRDAHPMATMVGVVGALSAFYHEDMDVHDPGHRLHSAIRLIAKMPTIAAWSYRYAHGLPFMYPDNSLSYSENFLQMMFSSPSAPYEPDPRAGKSPGRDFNSARRSRTKCLNLYRTSCGQFRSQSLCCDCCWYYCSMGSCPWWRQ